MLSKSPHSPQAEAARAAGGALAYIYVCTYILDRYGYRLSIYTCTYIHIHIVCMCVYLWSVCVLCGSPVWPSPPVVSSLRGPPLCVGPLWVGVLPCRVPVSRGIYFSSCLSLVRTLSSYPNLYLLTGGGGGAGGGRCVGVYVYVYIQLG